MLPAAIGVYATAEWKLRAGSDTVVTENQTKVFLAKARSDAVLGTKLKISFISLESDEGCLCKL